MSVLKALRDRVAPELNHLYTTPPAETPAGVDCGWHGREHAWSTYFVARLFGAKVDLCTGDFAILSRFLPPLTTMERDLDHAWCSVNGTAPIDLGMTFGWFNQAPQLRTPVIGEGRNGDWEIQYAEDESPMDESFSNRNEIIFVEDEVVAHDAAALLADPLLFLKAPAADDATAPATRFGSGIHAKVALHCFECAAARAKNVRHRLNRADAFAWIAENYPDAEERIREKLG